MVFYMFCFEWLAYLSLDIPVSHSVMSNSATPWTTVVHLAVLSQGFSRQEYWSWLPFPSPGIFLTQGSNLGLALQAVSLLTELSGKTLDLFLSTDDFWCHCKLYCFKISLSVCLLLVCRYRVAFKIEFVFCCLASSSNF